MFKIGDEVTWESQSGGYSKRKTGKIVYVVEEFETLKFFLKNLGGLQNYNTANIKYSFFARNHKSYLVEVKTGKTEKAKLTLYWPIVSKLKKVNNDVTE